MKPIDDSIGTSIGNPPPPSGSDPNYLTQDIMSALERATIALVDRVAEEQQIGRRQAAVIVLQRLRT